VGIAGSSTNHAGLPHPSVIASGDARNDQLDRDRHTAGLEVEGEGELELAGGQEGLVQLAAGLLELAGAAGDGEGEPHALDGELAAAVEDEGCVAQHVAAEHEGAARLVAADPAAGLVEQGVGEQDLVAGAVALGGGVDDGEVGLLADDDQAGGAQRYGPGGRGTDGGLGRAAVAPGPQGRGPAGCRHTVRQRSFSLENWNAE
jgi:hypothetical protein